MFFKGKCDSKGRHYYNYASRIDIIGVPMIVEFDWQLAEKPTHDYPGCDESISVIGIFINNEPIDFDTFFSDKGMELIEEAVLKDIRKTEEQQKADNDAAWAEAEKRSEKFFRNYHEYFRKNYMNQLPKR